MPTVSYTAANAAGYLHKRRSFEASLKMLLEIGNDPYWALAFSRTRIYVVPQGRVLRFKKLIKELTRPLSQYLVLIHRWKLLQDARASNVRSEMRPRGFINLKPKTFYPTRICLICFELCGRS